MIWNKVMHCCNTATRQEDYAWSGSAKRQTASAEILGGVCIPQSRMAKKWIPSVVKPTDWDME
jgi:hypothetical protein